MSPELRALVEAVKPPPLLLTNEQAADYVGYSPTTWAEAKGRGELPKPRRTASGLKYRRSDLDAYVEKLPPHGTNLPRCRRGRSPVDRDEE